MLQLNWSMSCVQSDSTKRHSHLANGNHMSYVHCYMFLNITFQISILEIILTKNYISQLKRTLECKQTFIFEGQNCNAPSSLYRYLFIGNGDSSKHFSFVQELRWNYSPKNNVR